MDPSSGQQQQHQQMSSQQSLENMIGCNSKAGGVGQQQQERKPRPQPELALNCPRCDSTNTKFCYYNNYSLSQPRYFCKSCRRYWTKGGSLRNVPVGGGCRKNKRSSSSSSSASSRRSQDHAFTSNNLNNPLIDGIHHLSYDHHQSSDLTLALARLQKQSCGMQLGFDDHDLSILGNPTSSLCDILGNQQGLNHTTTTTSGFLDALRSGFQGTHNNSMYYSSSSYNGNGDMGEVVDNGNSSCGEMSNMIPYDHDQGLCNAATQAVSVTTMKQEHMTEGRVLGGFPWQHSISGDHTNMGEIDSARASWNGFTSSWHGLLNSPLM